MSGVHRKIVDVAALVPTLRAAQAAGQTVVQCHGCFDIVHPGHIRYLQAARAIGDILVVSLTGDAGVAKGPDRPYIPQELRAESLAVLEFVDWVVVDPHPTACELLSLLRPDVYVKGSEYARSADPRFLAERAAVEQYGGRVVFHSGEVVNSSTRLLEHLRGDPPLDEQRLRALCVRSRITAAAARSAVEGIAGLRVVVVGDTFRERYVLCDTSGAADEAPVLSAQRLGAANYWGGAAAVALHAQALGAVPTLVTDLGRDRVVQRRARRLRGLPPRLHGLHERPETITRTTFWADDTRLFTITRGQAAPLDSRAERATVGVIRAALAEADALLWCDYGFGLVTPGLVAAGTAAAQARGRFVIGAAPHARATLLGLVGTNLLVATERRLRAAVHDPTSSLPAVVATLLAATGGRAALVTLRKRGIVSFAAPGREAAETGAAASAPERLRSDFVPSLVQHYVDLRGAEEALVAVAGLACARGTPLQLAAYLGAATEALTVTRIGGRTPTREDLLDWLVQRPELQDSRFISFSAPPPATRETPLCPTCT